MAVSRPSSAGSEQQATPAQRLRGLARELRLLWRQGTKQLWIEIREAATDRALRIRVQPELALDAFPHPYAYVP